MLYLVIIGCTLLIIIALGGPAVRRTVLGLALAALAIVVGSALIIGVLGGLGKGL